ncbi:unnamed protein product [Meloidogyne enterolobii]|uniref:Uncharacterized protein n=1 Tax=Meloidogyne enterolobii TaxID=390850 RepID=A0ACB0ZEB6_MELEN
MGTKCVLDYKYVHIYGGYSDVLISENRELEMTWNSRFSKLKNGNFQQLCGKEIFGT